MYAGGKIRGTNMRRAYESHSKSKSVFCTAKILSKAELMKYSELVTFPEEGNAIPKLKGLDHSDSIKFVNEIWKALDIRDENNTVASFPKKLEIMRYFLQMNWRAVRIPDLKLEIGQVFYSGGEAYIFNGVSEKFMVKAIQKGTNHYITFNPATLRFDT
jgi:hypothetical protein